MEGVNFETNEYEPEVETILSRLPDTQRVGDVQYVLSDEFNHWFGSSRELDEYYGAGKEI